MKLTYLLAFLLLACTTGFAQQKRDTVHPAAGAKKSKMKDDLGLNKKQEADLKASNKEYKSEKVKVKNDAKLTEAQKDAKIKELKAEKKKKRKKRKLKKQNNSSPIDPWQNNRSF